MAERDEIHPLSRVLGSIEADLKTVLRTQAEDRMADAQYKTDVRKELADVHDEIQSVSIDVKSAASAAALAHAGLQELKPKLEALQNSYLMGKGAARLATVLTKIGYGLGGGGVLYLLQRWLGKT